MIEFFSQTGFNLPDEEAVRNWIATVVESEGFSTGDIAYVFCDDAHLHRLNLEFLNHDTYTDILSFDYSSGQELSGEIYISIDRVRDNAKTYGAVFEDELRRVMIHGVLHFMGHQDKTENEQKQMREREDAALSLLQPDKIQ